MYCIYFLFLSIFVFEVNSQSIDIVILNYFASESVHKFRKAWNNHRKPLQNAISLSLKETVGLAGLNVYIRKSKEKIANGYYHNDNQVRLLLKDLALQDLPNMWLPEVQLSLASNVLKLQTSLSKIILHAEYALVRNKSDLIYEPKDQDPYRTSPFLFEQVQDNGIVAITMDACMLSGFILVKLNGESVNLGFNQFRMINCHYTFEIYRPGEDSPPVIAKYTLDRGDGGLDITHLLMKPINDELVPKLQGAMFSLVNTSSLFEDHLQEFRKKQEVVFQATAQYLTDVIRNLNKIAIKKNHGAINMENYRIQWDDGNIKPNRSDESPGEHVMLRDMVLTGLDTAYSAHSGGPYKLNTVVIGEEIRFSTLQVRGQIEIKSKITDKYVFAAEIKDMAVFIELDVKLKPPSHGLNKLEVMGYRRMILTVPSLIYGAVDAVVGGYLLNEVPKQIKAYLKVALPEALQVPEKKRPVKPAPSNPVNEPAEDPVSNNSDENEELASYEKTDYDIEDLIDLEKSPSVEELKTSSDKNSKVFIDLTGTGTIKKKKRFKSINRLRRPQKLAKQKTKHRGSKHTVDNEIPKK